MTDSFTFLAVLTHAIHARLHPLAARSGPPDEAGVAPRSDRGAVSIEQVLWYAAAAVSVAVVATIIWSQIKSTAGTGVNTPSAP